MCTSSGLVSKNLGLVANHVMEVHGLPGKYKCHRCNNGFNDERDLRRHNELTHRNDHPTLFPNRTSSEGSFICHVCGIIFLDSRIFLTHIETCRTMNYTATSTAPTHTNNANIGHFVEGNSSRDFLRHVICQTLRGTIGRKREGK